MASGRDVRDMLGLPMGGDTQKAAMPKRPKPAAPVKRIRTSQVKLCCATLYESTWLTKGSQRALRARSRRCTVNDRRPSQSTKKRRHTEQSDKTKGQRRSGTHHQALSGISC